MSMQVENDGESNDLEAVLEIIAEIARKSAGIDHIYRGETKLNKQVSSRLYREYEDFWFDGWNIEDFQKADLEEAHRFTHERDDFVILTELQHYGGPTNLIDFTTDYAIALFFACDGNHTQDGRVILFQSSGETEEHICRPSNPLNRVTAQKSVFVRPPKGYIEQYQIVTIPQQLKLPVLEYLRNKHGISAESIYNDLHGFTDTRTSIEKLAGTLEKDSHSGIGEIHSLPSIHTRPHWTSIRN